MEYQKLSHFIDQKIHREEYKKIRVSAPILALGKWKPSQINNGCNKDSVLAALQAEDELRWSWSCRLQTLHNRKRCLC